MQGAGVKGRSLVAVSDLLLELFNDTVSTEQIYGVEGDGRMNMNVEEARI
jgi:hypothetical protein